MRGLCQDSDIDRGYFLMNGDSRDNDGRMTEDGPTENKTSKSYHMKPVYEGYFYTIHWVPMPEQQYNGIFGCIMF